MLSGVATSFPGSLRIHPTARRGVGFVRGDCGRHVSAIGPGARGLPGTIAGGEISQELDRPVGCANSDRACELAVRIRRGAVVWRPNDRLGGPLRAVEVRLPHPVPLHPAIGAAGPRRYRQGPGDPGAPSPAGRAAPPDPRPRFEPADRAMLAAISRALPRSRWSCFFVRPETCCAGTGSWSPAPGPTCTAEPGDPHSTKSCSS
jgi:hypothetical protein